MFLRIVINTLTALLIFPVIISYREWSNILSGNYQYYDTTYESAGEYISKIILHPMAYPLMPVLFLLFILMPFQFIKNYYKHKGREPSFLKKWLIFSLLLVICGILWGMVSNIWQTVWYHNLVYLLYIAGFSLFFTSLLHVTADKVKEKPVAE
ncbi:hypothetical protein [Sphingobacterium spiritivorum]|uniref:hypothetical protein n=1 Tax=Sphingobacterium spiritivorum TaxID=258 RepID=UPI00191AC06A|nr:hypothetical protein [Sphingobacterium spiritivorum]QQT27528.1 hypothetical protein I6J02_06690 [Sphingobacterium spiritivorum]